MATASRRFEWNKAADYLERIGSGAVVRRFGWLADHVQAEIPPDVRERLVHLASRSRSAWPGLAPVHKVPDAIGYDEKWHLLVNVPRAELHGSAGLGRRKAIRNEQ